MDRDQTTYRQHYTYTLLITKRNPGYVMFRYAGLFMIYTL